MKVLVAFCTCPDAAVAERIAQTLVQERLAACVNELPGVTSTYRWQDKLCRDSEVLLVIKTTDERFDALRARVLALHPYELPELIAVEVGAAHAPYLDWVRAGCAAVD